MDLAVRLHYPFCNERGDNSHYLHSCTEPSVVAVRKKHYGLRTTAIYTCGLKKAAVCALTAMYHLDAWGRHIDPGANGVKACKGLIDNLLAGYPIVEPARGAFFCF